MILKYWFLLVAAFALSSCQTSNNSSATKGIFDRNHNPLPVSEVNSGKVAWRPLDKIMDGISGIGVLNVPAIVTTLDMCTTFLIDTKVDSGPAYIVTNAHCTLHRLGFDPLGPKEIRLNEETNFNVIFNHFMGVSSDLRASYKLTKLIYYTENGTDLSIFQLQKTLGKLKRDGFRPLKLATTKPAPGTKVRLVGVPLLRVPFDERSLHITETCEIFGNANLRNGIYSAPNSVIHNCSSVEGFSGGPVLDRKTNEVVLINSHGASGDSTDAPCTYASQPCEVDENGQIHMEIKRNYGQYLTPLVHCFDSNGRFTLYAPECELPK